MCTDVWMSTSSLAEQAPVAYSSTAHMSDVQRSVKPFDLPSTAAAPAWTWSRTATVNVNVVQPVPAPRTSHLKSCFLGLDVLLTEP